MRQEFSGRRRWASNVCGLCVALLAAWPAQAATGRTVPLYDGPSGATCDSFNSGGRIAWLNRAGDWLDASGKAQGVKPFAVTDIQDIDQERVIEWDVTGLVQQALLLPDANVQLVLRGLSDQDRGRAGFHSREAPAATAHPALQLVLASGTTKSFSAIADTFTDCSTSRSLGTRPTFSVGKGSAGLLAFDPDGIGSSQIKRATLRLTTTNRQFGHSSIGVFELQAPVLGLRSRPTLGLAARYPRDQGLDKDPNVVAVIDHESDAWRRTWTQVSGTLEVVRAPHGPGDPVLGRALQVTIPTGKVTGANTRFEFGKRGMAEPDAMYVRYYLRFDSSWDSTVEGGKLPGFAGTYNRGGWGGRRSNGTNGWSMRGFFQRQPEPENPLAGYVSIGTYAYHANMPRTYGELWMWSRNALGILERNRWYCVEQHVRLNDVGQANGVLRTWIDGELAFEKADITYRTVDTLKIEDFWLNVYHGGTKPVVSDQRLYVDNIVIARQYIGPMAP